MNKVRIQLFVRFVIFTVFALILFGSIFYKTSMLEWDHVYYLRSSNIFFNPEDRLLFGHIQSVLHGNGLGNFMFEMVSFLGIAKDVGRKPAFDTGNQRHLNKLLNVYSAYFPKLLFGIALQNANESVNVALPGPGSAKCTDYGPIFDEYEDFRLVRSKFGMKQCHSHFASLSRKEILSIFEFSPSHVKVARNEIVPGVALDNTHNICVHVRRGDFKSAPMEMTKEGVTIEGIKFVHNIVSKTNRLLNVIIIGNDQRWQQKISKTGNFSFDVHIHVGKSNKKWPPNIDWIFSNLYCDTVFLTAGASTYGWWLAYFSRGRSANMTTFYNDKLYKSLALEKTRMNRSTFFTEHFVPLHYDSKKNTIEFSSKVKKI